MRESCFTSGVFTFRTSDSCRLRGRSWRAISTAETGIPLAIHRCMKRLIGVALTLMLFGSTEPAAARCVPKYVLKIVVSMDTPDSPRKTIYRSGERFGRIEDPPNVIVVNEPDVWTVNRALRVGDHARDGDDDLVFRALILDDFGS